MHILNNGSWHRQLEDWGVGVGVWGGQRVQGKLPRAFQQGQPMGSELSQQRPRGTLETYVVFDLCWEHGDLGSGPLRTSIPESEL